nr:MAG TPA: hypothetical protein [Caudoviricetes sp.]
MIILYHGIPRKSSVLIKFFNFFIIISLLSHRIRWLF